MILNINDIGQININRDRDIIVMDIGRIFHIYIYANICNWDSIVRYKTRVDLIW